MQVVFEAKRALCRPRSADSENYRCPDKSPKGTFATGTDSPCVRRTCSTTAEERLGATSFMTGARYLIQRPLIAFSILDGKIRRFEAHETVMKLNEERGRTTFTRYRLGLAANYLLAEEHQWSTYSTIFEECTGRW